MQEHWLRNNLRLCVEAPQESFATLANEYFTDSVLMLELAKRRWDRGIAYGADQIVLFLDYFSGLGPVAPLYRITMNGAITVSEARLTRNASGNISHIAIGEVFYALETDANGFVTAFEGPFPSGLEEVTAGSADWTLHGNAPDPFSSSTRIRFEMGREAQAGLRVFDVSGRLVRTLLEPGPIAPGVHRILWDGSNEAGHPASPGVYLLVMEGGGRQEVERLVKVR